MTEGPSQDRPSDKDQIKPFHAKEVTTGQETADVLASVLKHAAAKDKAALQKAAPKAQPIWMLPFGLMLSVLAGFLLVAPPNWVVVNPIAAQSPEQQAENMESALYRQLNAIELYRGRNNLTPPPALEGIGAAEFAYSVSGQNYTLCGTVGDRDVCYNSAIESARDWAAREIPTLGQRIGG